MDQLPTTPEENTWYYTKKFQDGTDVPNDKRALYIVLEDVTVYNYMGIVGDIDLTDYYTKTESDNKLSLVYNKVFDLTTTNFRNGVLTTRITDTVTNSTIPTGSAVRSALATKQDTLINSDQYTAPSDTDKLSYVSGVTNNRWTFAKIWEWIVSKLTSNTEKGIQVSGGKLGHTNSITVPTAKRILQATYDAQGHITAIENAFNWSNTYNTSADNQLFTRKGANAMYTELQKVTRYTGNSAMSINNGGGLSSGADYSSEATRTINVVGKSAYFTCHLKYTSSASDAQWVKIGTIPTSLRPANYTTIVGQVYNNGQSSSSPYAGGNEAAGGYVNASGEVYLWVNKKYAGSNYQIRVTAQWFLS